MRKRITSLLCSLVLLINVLVPSVSAFASEIKHISRSAELLSAFTTNEDVIYKFSRDITNVRNSGITTNTVIDGCGYTLESMETGNGATVYQNENVVSSFSNLKFKGNRKGDVGIWLSAGSMTYTDSQIYNFNISTINQSAIAIAGSSVLTLNNTAVSGNSVYDINVMDSASVNINEGTTLDTLHIKSNFAKINIGEQWSGGFEIIFDNPTLKAIGTVAESADISSITVKNDGYFVAREGTRLVLKSTKERAIRFDFAQRNTLYKGSAGFLYGAAEINVPSVDLLSGLKPDTMVQKAIGGLQHPTGDATRTKSALLSSGVRDMQVYFQDNYLEWPYDAPVKDGKIDIDSYQKSVEKMVYAMICDKADKNTDGAFLGTDGKYYALNKENAKQYSYVLFNEPDQIWFGGNLSGLEAAWKQLYEAVHRIDPNARCVGPNYSGYSENDYKNFLAYCCENNCLPEIISWHELGDISLTDFYKHYDFTQNCVAEYYKNSPYQPELMVNEYARHYDIGAPGGLVKWLSMFEDKDMSGCMAYWAMANSLNELAADQNSPSSSWWVYHWYAQMTGKQCPLTSPEFDSTRLYGVASYDEDINMGYVIFGGNEDEGGEEVVYLDNLSSTDLLNSNGIVNVKLYGVSFSGQQGANYSPECIFNAGVKADGDTLRLRTADTDEMDAFFAVLTKPSDDAVAESAEDLTISTLSYEAENAALLGGARAYDKIGWATFATSGRADVGNICKNGDGVQFDVSIDEDGVYNASLFYSLQAPFVNPETLEPNQYGQNRGIGKTLPFGVIVDGERLDDIYLESTVSWAYKNHCDITLSLAAGRHTISFVHINGDESQKGNLQLTAALDKLDLTRISNPAHRYDFEICLDEMTSFKTGDDTYKLTAVAGEAGYYNISSDGEISLSKQSIDYAADAKTYSEITTFDIPVSDCVYLSKGANTLKVKGNAGVVRFEYDSAKTVGSSTVVTAEEITLHGNNPVYRESTYSSGKKVISQLGIGQSPTANETGEHNYTYFKVNAQTGGVYNLAIRYSNDEPAPVMLRADGSTYIHPYNIDLVERYAQIKVNDSESETVYFRNTMSWDTFRTVDVQVVLTEGENVIKIYNDNSYQFSPLVNSTAPEIDTVTVSKLSYDSTAVSKIEKQSTQAHSFTSVSKTTKATTSKNGSVVATYTCSECGYKYSKTTKTIYRPKTVTLSATSYTYSGSAKKPAVTVKDSNGKAIAASNYTLTYANNKNVGTASVKVTFKGNYSGTITKNFVINPKATTLKSVTAKSKGFTAKWSKLTTQTTGYQLQYSTSSKFTSAKTKAITSNKTSSATIKSLKSKKKYYVRIRTYKTVNGKKYYSAWSKAKTVTTKK